MPESPKWRLWFNKYDQELPWRIQHVEDIGKDDRIIKASHVSVQYAETEFDWGRNTVNPPHGVLVCWGKVFLDGTKVIIS